MLSLLSITYVLIFPCSLLTVPSSLFNAFAGNTFLSVEKDLVIRSDSNGMFAHLADQEVES